MIHLLVVSPNQTPEQIAKLARRYAMTGGYEVALADNLDDKALEKLIDIYLPFLEQRSKQSMKYRSSNAYRILSLVSKAPEINSESRTRLKDWLME